MVGGFGRWWGEGYGLKGKAPRDGPGGTFMIGICQGKTEISPPLFLEDLPDFRKRTDSARLGPWRVAIG